MEITALAPWYGSKRTLAPIVCEELGPHLAYWEPFCGSMATLLIKKAVSFETVNDLHHDLINLARCLQHPNRGPELYRRLRRTLNSQEGFKECRQRCKSYPDACTDLDPQRAYDYFVTSWQGMNGLAGTKRYNLGFARRFTKGGGHAATRFASTVDSIPAWRRRLRGVTILSSDGISLCENIRDEVGTAIYADPPYLCKGAQYHHDFTEADHVRLAKALCRFKNARVVVSYYEHPELVALYPGWTVRKAYQVKALVSQGRRGKENDAVAPEVLLINGESFGGGKTTGLFDQEVQP